MTPLRRALSILLITPVCLVLVICAGISVATDAVSKELFRLIDWWIARELAPTDYGR